MYIETETELRVLSKACMLNEEESCDGWVVSNCITFPECPTVT